MKKRMNIVMVALLTILASCSTNYQMVTRVHKDGTVEKEVWALADSAFLAGDSNHNPFLFRLGKDWEVEELDSCIETDFFGETGKLNLKACKTRNGLEGMDFFSAKEKWMRPLAVPKEKLEKHFRWFYTYYTYTCDFQEIKDKGPIPMDKYLSKAEQLFLSQGKADGYAGMNGVELINSLEDTEQRFLEWFYHTQFEMSYGIVEHFLKKTPAELTYLSRLEKDKEEIFRSDGNRKKEMECSPEYICRLLDKRYQTAVFGNLYKDYARQMEQLFEEKCIATQLFEYQIKFELSMPGELLSSNTVSAEDGTLVWKVDAYRVLADNYRLQAESRVMNIWAFVLTGLLLAVALILFIPTR